MQRETQGVYNLIHKLNAEDQERFWQYHTVA